MGVQVVKVVLRLAGGGGRDHIRHFPIFIIVGSIDSLSQETLVYFLRPSHERTTVSGRRGRAVDDGRRKVEIGRERGSSFGEMG